jgi:hypothetical protein
MTSSSKIRRLWWRIVLVPIVMILGYGVTGVQPSVATPMDPGETVSQVAAPDGPSAHCYAGQWTQVRAWWHPFGIPYGERYVVNPGVFVEWRWFQDGFPQYWYNTFTSSADIIYTPSWFTSLEFKCAADSPVWVYSLI